ncbi:MAG TPA: cytochrome c oxidase accessory protein CcoG [Bauldia sp.]|nr:cytochrome c oxidase accessory protein CcoG [Bauldia sp.]
MDIPAKAAGIPSDDQPFYKPRQRIYPQSVHGTYRRIKWIVLLVTLGIYYLTPFIRWDRGPGAPDQAVLIDLPNRRFYFFFIEIWPQEVYYLTGLLILAALFLFLMNAVAGRVWCGYLCPQTVWTDLFLAIERWTEGDRRERMKQDAGPLTPSLLARKSAKHFLWLMIAWWTGGAWVLYFADAPTLVHELATLQAPLVAYIWIGILTFTTYTLAGHMREQVCLYMCPWPRIQAALTDDDAFNVTYRFDRGEPRMSAKKAAAARSHGELAGDCIDCNQCVAVCPTGVDIRQGPSLGCIQCGLCIDACDTVMEKIDRAPRLIAYDTDINIKRRQQGEAPVARIVRPRTILYSALIVVVGAIMLWSLSSRTLIEINVLHDRNPEFVRLSDGGVRNAYTIRILNKHPDARTFGVAVDGLSGARLEVVGATGAAGSTTVDVGPDQTRELRAVVNVDAPPPATSLPLTFIITDLGDGTEATVTDNFRGPGNGETAP